MSKDAGVSQKRCPLVTDETMRTSKKMSQLIKMY